MTGAHDAGRTTDPTPRYTATEANGVQETTTCFWNDSNAQRPPDTLRQTHPHVTPNMHPRNEWGPCPSGLAYKFHHLTNTDSVEHGFREITITRHPLSENYAHLKYGLLQVQTSFHREVLDGPKIPLAQRTHVKLSRRICVNRCVCVCVCVCNGTLPSHTAFPPKYASFTRQVLDGKILRGHK